MNITLPSGEVITDVPDGTTRKQLLDKLAQTGGYEEDVRKMQLASAPKIGAAGLPQAAQQVGREGPGGAPQRRYFMGAEIPQAGLEYGRKIAAGIGESAQRYAHGLKDLAMLYQGPKDVAERESEERGVAREVVSGTGLPGQAASIGTDIAIGFAVPGAAPSAVPRGAGQVLIRSLPGQTAMGAAGSPDSPEWGAGFGAAGTTLGVAIPRGVQAARARMQPDLGSRVAGPGLGQRLATEAGTTPTELATRVESGIARAAPHQVPLSTAQAAQSPELAGRELGSRGLRPELFSQLQRGQNEAIYEAAQQATPRATAVKRLEQRRDQVTAPLREAALDAARQDPWFAVPVVQAVQTGLRGASSANPAVRTVLGYVERELGENAATAMTPERLYEVRKVLAAKLHGPLRIGDELSSAAKGAQRETLNLMKTIDAALERSSGGLWTPYMEAYKSASRPVENAVASHVLRRTLGDKPELVGGAPAVTGRVLTQAMKRAGASKYKEAGKFAPRTLEDLESLRGLVRENIEEPMRTAKLAGTGGGGSQTATQAGQMVRTGLTEMLGTGMGVPGAATAVNLGGAVLKGVWRGEYARLLADPERALAAIRAAEVAGRPLNPAQQAFAAGIAQAGREGAEEYTR